MNPTKIIRAALRLGAALLVCVIALAQNSQPSARFDGKWMTTLACPEKGSAEGYTWQFPSVVQSGNFRGEHGTAGEPGYLLIEGRIAEDGSAKLAANGLVASRKYARGILAHKGEEYGYDIKAQFNEKDGTGTRNAGLGIVGRPCTFTFARQ